MWEGPIETTDAQGRGVFSHLRPGFGHYRLVAGHKGYATSTVRQIFIGPGEQSLSVVLGPGVSIAGRVRSAAGEGIQGAVVRLGMPGEADSFDEKFGLPMATTGPNGEFVLRNVEPGVWGLVASTAGFRSEPYESVPEIRRIFVGAGGAVGWRRGVRAPAAGIEITIRKGSTVTAAAPPGGEPLVWGVLRGNSVPARFELERTDRGTYVASNVPTGSYTVVLGGAAWPVEVDVEGLRTELPSGMKSDSPCARGVVLDSAGQPVESAVVQLVVRYHGVWTPFRVGEYHTGSDGRFELPGSGPADEPDAPLALLATRGSDVGMVLLPPEDRGEAEIRLRPTDGKLRIRTVDALSGAPLRAWVKVRPEWQSDIRAGWSDASGWSEQRGFVTRKTTPAGMPPPTGRQRVWAGNLHSYFPWGGHVEVKGETEFGIPLRRRPVFTGRVVDEEGAPVNGLRVVCADGEADTNADGEFRILGLRPNADFRNLRWSRLPRSASDWQRFMGLASKPGEPGVFVVPSLAKVDLTLRVDPALEGAQVFLDEGDEAGTFPRAPSAFVDQCGEARLGAQFEGDYRAIVRTVDQKSRVLGAFALFAGEGDETQTIDLRSPLEEDADGN